MKKKYIIILITLSLILSGCSLDEWTAIGVLDGVVSTATGNNKSDPTPTPTKSPETIEKENKVLELFEQENLGYDLAYNPKYYSGYTRYYNLCLVDFERQVETTITCERGDSPSYIVIKTRNITGTIDTDWADTYEINDKSLYKYAIYKRIAESGGEKVIEFFQKYTTSGEKGEIVKGTEKIWNLEERVERFKELLDKDCRNTAEKYDRLFPQES